MEISKSNNCSCEISLHVVCISNISYYVINKVNNYASEINLYIEYVLLTLAIM